jgi:hypothetical protein
MNWLAYDTFEPGVNTQVEYEATIYQMFEKSMKGVEGRTAKIKLQTGDGNVGNIITDGGPYPNPLDPTGAEASITLTQIGASTAWTTAEWNQLGTSTAAAEDVIEFKMRNLKDTLLRDIVRQSWSDGTARLARCSAATNVNVVPIQSTSTNQVDRDRGIWLAANRIPIDLVDATTGTAITNGTSRIVTDVDFTSGASTVTVSGSANLTPTANTVIVRAGNVAGGGTYTSGEWGGLAAVVDNDNTYLGINRSTGTNRFWRSTVLANSGTLRALTWPLIHSLRSEVAKQGVGKIVAPDWCYMANQGVFAAYGDLLGPQVRFNQTNELLKLDGGWSSLEIFGAPLYEDIHCPRNNLFALYKPSINFRVAKKRNRVFWTVDYDGGPYRMQPGTTAGTINSVVLYQMEGFVTIVSERPNLHGRLDDLSEIGVVN